MKLRPELVPFLGLCFCALLGWVEVHAHGLAILPLVYAVSFVLGAVTGVWWLSVGSRR